MIPERGPQTVFLYSNAMHSKQFALYAICPLCNAHYAMQYMQCTLCNAHYAMHSMQCTLCSAHYAMHSMQCTLCNAQYAVHSMQCTLCNALYAMHSMLCTLCYALYAMQSMLSKVRLKTYLGIKCLHDFMLQSGPYSGKLLWEATRRRRACRWPILENRPNSIEDK